jgi:hypothetical protein
MMQWFVDRWCVLIGVTDPFSIQIATGVVAGVLLTMAVGFIARIAFGILEKL